MNGFTLAQCLLLLAELKHRNGRAADARLAANEALAIVEALHAPGVLGDRARRLDYVLRNGREPRPDEPLSEREIEVVRLFAAGLTKREVAGRLYVSFNTVHSHAKAIYRKLGAATRDEMLDRAAAGGVL